MVATRSVLLCKALAVSVVLRPMPNHLHRLSIPLLLLLLLVVACATSLHHCLHRGVIRQRAGRKHTFVLVMVVHAVVRTVRISSKFRAL